jgi:type IV secretion system protein VirD4
MVSRQETARPLLTPGEVMQLPPADELLLVAGVPPVRAKKARYYEDARFRERILPPPKPAGERPEALPMTGRRWRSRPHPRTAPEARAA